MSGYSIPTSRDIYIEADGLRLGTVQSYKAVARRKTRLIESFGESEPVAAIAGRVSYELELQRVDTSPAFTDGVDFFSLDGFNLVVVKPDRRIVYSGCRWSDISESCGLGEPIIEKIGLIASRRQVLK